MAQARPVGQPPATARSRGHATGGGRTRAERGGLDSTDVELIGLLNVDGRLTNRELGRRLGLAEVTVAARIQALMDRRLLGVTAVVDWRAAGFEWDMWLEVSTQSGTVFDVGRDLAGVAGVDAVYTVFGPYDLVVHAILRGREDAVAFLNDRVASIRGVVDVRASMTLETLKYSFEYSRIGGRETPDFPAPVVAVDDLDRAIVDALVTDGRQSNRAIARSLGVVEGTIRVRLRRLEHAGLLRIVGQSDPYLAGTVSAFAMMVVTVEPGRRRAVAEALRDLEETTAVATTLGEFDVIAGVAAASRTRLTELGLEVVRAIPGVRSTQTWEIVRALKPSANLAAFV